MPPGKAPAQKLVLLIGTVKGVLFFTPTRGGTRGG